MITFNPGAYLPGGDVNFLDATEEEVIEFVRSLLSQLEIMTCCLAIPSEQKKILKANIGCVEAYLNCRNSTH